MKPFSYQRAIDIASACASAAQPTAKFIAGGTKQAIGPCRPCWIPSTWAVQTSILLVSARHTHRAQHAVSRHDFWEKFAEVEAASTAVWSASGLLGTSTPRACRISQIRTVSSSTIASMYTLRATDLVASVPGSPRAEEPGGHCRHV